MKTCYVIGGGASLEGFDFEQLRGCDIVGVNDSMLLDIPIKYGLFHDGDWLSGRQSEVAGKIAEGSQVYTTGTNAWRDVSKRENTRRFLKTNFRDRSTLPFYRCSGNAGIALALMEGYRRICLLGFDCHHVKDSTHKSHWHKPRRAQNPSVYPAFIHAAIQLRDDAKKYFPGVEIINMHPEGQEPSSLPCWPVRPFELFKPTPVVEGPSILVPPGIGDFYWVAAYLEDFAKQEGLELPLNIYMYTPEAPKFDRAHDFVDSFPFCSFKGYERHISAAEWRAGYLEDKALQRNVKGAERTYDYFLCPNGSTRYGGKLEDAAAPYKLDWNVWRKIVPEADSPSLIRGKFFLCHFIKKGMFGSAWWPDMGTDKIMELIDRLVKDTGYTAVLTGAHFDDKVLPFASRGPKYLDLIGATSTNDLLTLSRDCEFAVGWPDGSTLMPQVMEKPTHLIWSDYFCRGFQDSFGRDTPAYRKYMVTQTAQEIGDGILGLSEPKPAPPHTAPVVEKSKTTIAWVYKTGGHYDGQAERLIADQHLGLKTFTPEINDYVCLTDSEFPLPEGVRRVPLDFGLKGWFSKFELFRTDIFDDGQRVMFLDLDTQINGSIHPVTTLPLERFYMLEDFYHPGRHAAGVLVFEANKHKYLLDQYIRAKDAITYSSGDQRFIELRVSRGGTPLRKLQNAINDTFYSYKVHVRGLQYSPLACPVLCYHGNPRPWCVDTK